MEVEVMELIAPSLHKTHGLDEVIISEGKANSAFAASRLGWQDTKRRVYSHRQRKSVFEIPFPPRIGI